MTDTIKVIFEDFKNLATELASEPIYQTTPPLADSSLSKLFLLLKSKWILKPDDFDEVFFQNLKIAQVFKFRLFSICD